MLITSWLSNLCSRLQYPPRSSRPRPRRVTPRAVAAEVEVLEPRHLLSSILTDTTPTATESAVAGGSTGSVVLATFHDAIPPEGLTVAFDVPGGTATVIEAVSGSSIAGTYTDSSGALRGFVYDGSVLKTFSPPSQSLNVVAVSGMNVLGTYGSSINPGSGPDHAFFFNGSTVTTFDYPNRAGGLGGAGISGDQAWGNFDTGPSSEGNFLFDGSTSTVTQLVVPGAKSTGIYGIYNGDAVGLYLDAGWQAHGFLYNGSTYETIDVPGAARTFVRGASSAGITGYFEDAGGNTHGFLYNGSTFTTIDPPGAANTQVTAISGTNVVGIFQRANGNWQGFLFDGTNFTVINPPGSNYTYISGVSGGTVTGWYTPGGAATGFSPAFSFQFDGSTYTTSPTFSFGANQDTRYEPAPTASSFTASVDWGGALVGTPTVSVQRVSQSTTGSTWEVVGNATYAQPGNYTIAVTVTDSSGNSVSTSNTTISVASPANDAAPAPTPAAPTDPIIPVSLPSGTAAEVKSIAPGVLLGADGPAPTPAVTTQNGKIYLSSGAAPFFTDPLDPMQP